MQRMDLRPKGSCGLGGVCLDAQGGVWTALQDGWSVVRFSPDGALDRVIGLPVPAPTDIALGGATLYITSARHSLPIESLGNAPLSSRLFAAHLDPGAATPSPEISPWQT